MKDRKTATPLDNYESKAPLDEDKGESTRYPKFIDVITITISLAAWAFIVLGFYTGFFKKVYTSAFTKNEVSLKDLFELKSKPDTVHLESKTIAIDSITVDKFKPNDKAIFTFSRDTVLIQYKRYGEEAVGGPYWQVLYKDKLGKFQTDDLPESKLIKVVNN